MDNPKNYWDIVTVPYQMGPQKHRLYILDLLKKFGVKSLLDVGCGTGPIFEIITSDETWDNLTKYKGVDYSENFINWAQENFGKKYFDLQDARDLKEADASYDCVLLMHSLDHVKQYEEVISEAARVSKKYICIIVWQTIRPGGGVVVNDRNMISKNPEDDPWEDTYLVQYSKEALGEEFKKNNLKVVLEVSGDELNSEQCKYNYLFFLEKHESKSS